jgi:hypothetical protein
MKSTEKKKTKAEGLEELKHTLREWQKIEDGSVAHASAIIEKTQNTLIRLVMEIIRHDSVMHKRVQQAILDSLEKESFTLRPEELAEIWDSLKAHDEAEKKAIELAEKASRNCPLVAQRQLLEYLIEDERKHDRLLGHLENFKRQLYPYA